MDDGETFERARAVTASAQCEDFPERARWPHDSGVFPASSCDDADDESDWGPSFEEMTVMVDRAFCAANGNADTEVHDETSGEKELAPPAPSSSPRSTPPDSATSRVRAVRAPAPSEPELIDAVRVVPDWVDARAVVVESSRAAHQENPENHWMQAFAALQAGDHKAVVRECTRALAIKPDYIEAYVLRATGLFELHRYQEAIADATKALKIDERTIAAYDIRARARSLEGQHSDAIDDYDMAITLNPADAELFLKRGDIKAASGDLRGAIDDYSVVIAMKPTDPRGFFKRGALRFARDDARGASADWDRGMELAGPMDLDRCEQMARLIGRS